MKIVCACCGRQIVSNRFLRTSSPMARYITYGPAKVLCAGKYACAECSADLDKNGLFPEERAQLERLERLERR